MKGTNGRSPRRWWHRLGLGRRSDGWWDVEITDSVTAATGSSERGIAVDVVVMVWSEMKVAHACAYMDATEARAFAADLERAIADYEAGQFPRLTPLPESA